MGRTVPTYRMHLESIIGSWMDYRRALRKEDRRLFDRLVAKARQHASAASFCPHMDPLETILLSILLEMEREIETLRSSRSSVPIQVRPIPPKEGHRADGEPGPTLENL